MNDSPDAQNGTTAQNSVTKPTRRRRHDYSPEIADLICDRIAGGASLRQICQDANMPAKSTIFVWLEEHQDFARLYTLARQMQIEDLMDEILEIADDSSNDWIDREGPDGKKYRVFNPDSIRQSKLRIGARKWLISKLMPKRYGWK
jgi:hypothetical protein